jgi:hypothetical protein
MAPATRVQTPSTMTRLATLFMKRLRAFAALLCLVLAGCAGARPPEELSGLWSAGPAACAAGVGVRFRGEAIQAIYDRQVETLFDQPRYQVEDRGDRFRVRITYALPRIAGGVRAAGARGVIILSRQPNGGLAPARHALIDTRTGTTRLRIADDPVSTLMTLEPCGPHPWREGLRGRASA